MKTNKIKNYTLGIILSSFFLISIYQLTKQHWSSIMDMDSAVIYNSLLLASGYEQEFRDHPAFTLFLINGLIFKFLSFFQNIYPVNIDVILQSEKINETFQFYFNVARITNSFLNILFICIFYHLLDLLRIKRSIIFFTCLLFMFSEWYFLSFFVLRVEILSLLFFTISIIFTIRDKKNLYLNYFIAGIFLALAMLSKIQIIFFIAYPLILIPFTFFKKNYSNLNFEISKIISNYLLLSFIFGVFSFIIFQFIIHDHPRFEKNVFLDLFFFLFSFLIILLYYFIINKFKYIYFKKNIILLSSILNGFVFFIIVLIVLDKFNILQVNDYILLRITNPIHYLTEFTYVFAEGTINSNFLLTKSFQIFTSYSYNLLELILLLIVIFLTVKKNINKDNYFVTLILAFFLIFLLNATINSFKYAVNYHAYYIFCYLFVFSICINNLDFKISKYLASAAIIICLYNSLYVNNFKKSDKYSLKHLLNRNSKILSICKEFSLGIKTDSYINISYLKYYHHKFNDNEIKQLCKEIYFL